MRKNTVVLFFLLLSFGIFFFPEMLNAQSDRYTGISKLNSGYWVKIRISESGIYQISYADLRAWGFVDPAKVKLYGYGGAMLAAVACGEYSSVESAAEKLVKVVDTIEPDEELVARYNDRYAQFAKIYPTVKTLFHEII